MKRITRKLIGLIRPRGPIGLIGLIGPMSLMGLMGLGMIACDPEPPLHLYDAEEADVDFPIVDVDLQVYWDYELSLGISYDWTVEWYYGWDETDQSIFGELEYEVPTAFNLRRYYTGDTPYAPHTSVQAYHVEGYHFQALFEWGFWDLLVWNDIQTLDGVQSLILDETTSLDSVTAYTNPSMHLSRYHAPAHSRSYYTPEPLFAAYSQAMDINRSLTGFTYDAERNVWVRQLNMELKPITYIYLTQVILHNNRGRVTSTDGSSTLSGMARTTTLNTGRAGDEAVAVYYNSRMKHNVPLVPYKSYKTQKANGTNGTNGSNKTNRTNRANRAYESGELVDIIGGRLMTFGMCSQTPNNIKSVDELTDRYRHYMDVTMQFNNGMDSTFVFDVTDQVRRRYKGGVITVELDLDTVPIPSRRGGSGFDAVVLEPDSVTHVIEM